MITGIVLAGGRSSRFGDDKLASLLEGVPVLHRALRAVGQVAGDVVLVLAPGSPVPVLPPDLATRLAVAHDAQPGGGPLAGLAAGLAAGPAPSAQLGQASRGEDGPRIALVVGGDMPWLDPAVLRLLATRLEAGDRIVAMTLGSSAAAPLPLAVRAVAARAAVEACLAGSRRSLRSLLEAVPSGVVPEAEWRALDPQGRTLWDVDVPSDLDRR